MRDIREPQEDLRGLKNFLESALEKAMPFHEYKSGAVALVPSLKSPQAIRLGK